MTLTAILLVLSLVFAVLSFFLPSHRLTEVAVILISVALLIGAVK